MHPGSIVPAVSFAPRHCIDDVTSRCLTRAEDRSGQIDFYFDTTD